MKHIRGLVSTTQALRQTFFIPQALPRPQLYRYPSLQPPSQIRFRATISRSQYGKDETKDENIPWDYIQLVNPDNKLDPPVSLKRALSSIERPGQYILQVSPGSEDKYPICKILSRREVQERTRNLVKAAQAAKVTVKQVELNWAIDAHDLSHRLKQVTKFLEKGRQVEVILMRKKQKRTPTPEEVKYVMDSVLKAVEDAGATQVTPMEGQPGKRVVYTVRKKDS